MDNEITSEQPTPPNGQVAVGTEGDVEKNANQADLSFEQEVDQMLDSNFGFEDQAVSDAANNVKIEENFEKTLEENLEENFEKTLEEKLEAELEAKNDSEIVDIPLTEISAVEVDTTTEHDNAFNLNLDFLSDQKQLEKEWKERTGLDEETLSAAIETIVFMSDRPVSIVKIKKVIDANMPSRAIYDAIQDLQNSYEQKNHGIRLVEVAEGYQFRTKLNYASYVESINKSTSFSLSPTALEVLAIIAYRQPISRTEIDKMRGVDSSHIVRALMDKRLVSIAGRSNELGRPTTFKTTPEFLEFFNLNTLEDLPEESELVEMTQSDFGKISDIKEICKGEGRGRFEYDDMDELDELSDTIKQISAETDFTKSLKTKNEEGKSASPFELMEHFLQEEELTKENKNAVGSEFFTAVNMVNVISDLSSGPFNEPEEETNDLPLISDEQLEQMQDALDEELQVSANEEGQKNTLLGQFAGDCEEELEEELIQAQEDGELYAEASDAKKEELIQDFNELQDLEPSNLLDKMTETDSLQEDELFEVEGQIDNLSEEAMKAAEDLDLDLSFLKPDNSSASGTMESEDLRENLSENTSENESVNESVNKENH